MTADLKILTDMIEERKPETFRLAYPRNIIPPTGYCNPRYYAASVVGSLLVVEDPVMRQLPHVTAYMNSLALMAAHMPTYFIAYEFAQSVANTDLPGDFKFDEIKWPLPAQLLVLPDQFVLQYFGCYAPFLSICQCPAGVYPKQHGVNRSEIQYLEIQNSTNKILIDYPVYPSSGTPIDYNGNYPMSGGIDLFRTCTMQDVTAYEEEIHGFHYEPRGIELDPETEKVFVDKMLLFSMKLIMAVSCRPGLVEPGQMTRPMKMKHGRVRPELWTPNIIGRSYRIQRQKVSGVPYAHNGGRFIFRRGHWTWQAKRFKGVEFVSVDSMPKRQDGGIDFDTAGTVLSDKFRTTHERLWIEGILFENVP